MQNFHNKKGFTLIELVLYIVIVMIIMTITISIFNKVINSQEEQSLLVEKIHNIDKAQKNLGKTLENINEILILNHVKEGTHISNIGDILINNKFYNQHNFSFLELRDKCGFITDENYDLIALKTEKGLDPVIVGVVEKKDENNRIYRQLAVYRYYSTYYQKDFIDRDIKNGRVSDLVDEFWNYKTEGLTGYKCNSGNGFLKAISSKFYVDEIKDYDYTLFLKRLKIIPYVKTNTIDEIKKYKTGLLKIELDWESRMKNRANIDYQVFSKVFKY